MAGPCVERQAGRARLSYAHVVTPVLGGAAPSCAWRTRDPVPEEPRHRCWRGVVVTLERPVPPVLRPAFMHFQPIFDLHGAGVFGFEALARTGTPEAPAPPTALFARAAREGRLPELDWACRAQALRAASAGGLGAWAAGAVALFVNAEPASSSSPFTWDFLEADRALDPGVVRVLEITERALTGRPGPLLDMLDAVRAAGWRIALDDVGVVPASLSLLPVLQPDVVKLDLQLVQRRSDAHVAETVSAVAAYAEETGALVLAEGIETRAQADLAVSMGARLGQGYLLGRPAPLAGLDAYGPGPVPTARPHGAHDLPRWRPPVAPPRTGTPYDLVAAKAPALRRATKPLLVGIARWLERQALVIGEPAVLISTFEHQRHFSPPSVRRYGTLASCCSLVVALGQEMPEEPAPGVRGIPLAADDPLVDEWDVLVLGPHFAAALVAIDLGDTGPDDERRFDYTVTYERSDVVAAARGLLARLRAAPPRAARTLEDPARPLADDALAGLLGRALAQSDTGLSVARVEGDRTTVVYANGALSALSGQPREELLGRGLPAPWPTTADADVAAVLQAAVRAGLPVRVTVPSTRADGARWWDELELLPVHGDDGRVEHWVGIHRDVSDRVAAQARATHLARHDTLTNLPNRRHHDDQLEVEMGRATRHGTSLAMLFLDLDGFKPINDRHGHAVGDELLMAVARRLRSEVRTEDLLARHGGDEFLVLLTGLPADRDEARAASQAAADKLRLALSADFELDGAAGRLALRATVSVGISLFPHDGTTAQQLREQADRAMYAAKAAGRNTARASG